MVLVSGLLLFVRTLQLLACVDGGFRTEGVLIATLAGRVPWSEAEPEFFHELLRKVRALAGAFVPAWRAVRLQPGEVLRLDA